MEARPKNKPDGSCELCGDPVQMLPATGRLLNMDGRAHDRTHVERLRNLSLQICDALNEFHGRGDVATVELDEKNPDGFLITDKTGRGYWYRCTRMARAVPKRKG